MQDRNSRAGHPRGTHLRRQVFRGCRPAGGWDRATGLSAGYPGGGDGGRRRRPEAGAYFPTRRSKIGHRLVERPFSLTEIFMQQIIVATNNQGKLREIREICAGFPLALSSLRDHWNPAPSIPENGATFLENARAKAQWVFDKKGIWSLADDSGLRLTISAAARACTARGSRGNGPPIWRILTNCWPLWPIARCCPRRAVRLHHGA